MSMRNNRSVDPLDALIEDVARRMTDGRAPLLQAQVAERIRARQGAWRIRWWQPAIAAAALAVAVLRFAPEPPTERELARTEVRASPRTDRRQFPRADARESAGTKVGQSTRTNLREFARADRRALRLPVQDAPPEVPIARELPPIDLAELEVNPIVESSLRVDDLAAPTPLIIERVALEPLAIPQELP
jgi:hypothetical protein